MLRFLAAAAILVIAAPASAQTVAEVESAWRGWMTKHDRKAGGLALLHRGKLVHEAAMGRVNVGMPVPLASLSKAVTGVCIGGLVDRGKLSFATPLSQALAKTFARIGPPADQRLAGVTIAQLLVHRAGYDRSSSDPATGPLSAYLPGATAKNTAFDDRMKALLRQKLPLAPGERYAYTNASYLILGAVVEETSGQDYESYCKQTVLTPLGANSASLDPAWRILSSFGGWRMTLGDYGRFYQAFALGNPAIGPVARRWMMSPDGKSIGGGAHYGLGTDVRPLAGGDANFWHWGRWSYNLSTGYDGPLMASYSTFAVRWGPADANLVADMEPDMAEGAPRNDLDRAMGAAVGAIKRWP